MSLRAGLAEIITVKQKTGQDRKQGKQREWQAGRRRQNEGSKEEVGCVSGNEGG